MDKNYSNILDFLEKNANKEYIANDMELKLKGQLAYDYSRSLGYNIENKIDGFTFIGSSKWQNSGHISNYFWLQFKRKGYEDDPYSISITTIPYQGKYIFKVYVEVSDKDLAKYIDYNQKLLLFNKAILKIPQLNTDFYYEGKIRKEKKYIKINKDVQSIADALASEKYSKITTNIDIKLNDLDDKEFELNIINAFKLLIPHYDAIFDDINHTEYWVLPCNLEKYDIISAFNNLKALYWQNTNQTQSIRNGDIVYIYVGKPFSRLMYECIVTDTNIDSLEIEGTNYYKEQYSPINNTYFRIKLIKKLNSLNLSLTDLNENGVIGRIQSVSKINNNTKQFIIKNTNDNETIIDKEEFNTLQNLNEKEIETILEMDDNSSGYEYKNKLVKTRKMNIDIINKLKQYYKGECQLCGAKIGSEFGKEIVEAHHIEYFSKTQNNDSSNIIILCPNCHKLIHACNPIYNKKNYSFDFENNKIIKIKNIGHLKQYTKK